MEEKKPFVFGVPATGSNFTDREQETARLVMNFKHGINTILISPRRWGKTSLVRKAISKSESDDLKIVYLDIFACRSERDFYDAFASAVLKQTSSKLEEWLQHAKMFLTRINPKISMGTDPMADFSVSLELNPDTEDVDEILQLPERIARRKGINIVVCIDEFQQIGEFKDSKAVQKRLRSVWQLQQSVSYCLFGSKKHLMNELFERRSLPFYKFGDAIYLSKIETPYWVEYIRGRFESTGKKISKELAERIAVMVDNHSSYVQQLAWLVWIHAGSEATDKDLDMAYQDLLNQNTPLFERQTENLTTYQLNLLRAIVDGHHTGFSTREMLQTYQLGTSANVSVAKRALIKQELIDTDHRQVYISDPVLQEWLRREL